MVNIPSFTPGCPNIICVAGSAGLLLVESFRIPIAFAASCITPRRQRRLSPTTRRQPQRHPFHPRAVPYQLPNATLSDLSLGCYTQERSLLLNLPAELRPQIWAYAMSGNEFHLMQKGNRVAVDRSRDSAPWHMKA